MKPSQVSAELRRIASGIDSCSTEVRPDLVSRDLRRVLASVRTAEGEEIQVVVMSFVDWENDESRNEVLEEHFGGTAWHVYVDFVIPAKEPIGLDDVRPVKILDLRTDTDNEGQAVPESAPSLKEGLEIADAFETEQWLQGWEKISVQT